MAKKHNVTILPNGRIQYRSKKSLDAFQRDAKEQIDVALTETLEPLSEAFSGRMKLVSDINPVVYATARDVMRYGAFFRYCKKTDRRSFNLTASAVFQINPGPKLRTPNGVRK